MGAVGFGERAVDIPLRAQETGRGLWLGLWHFRGLGGSLGFGPFLAEGPETRTNQSPGCFPVNVEGLWVDQVTGPSGGAVHTAALSQPAHWEMPDGCTWRWRALDVADLRFGQLSPFQERPL